MSSQNVIHAASLARASNPDRPIYRHLNSAYPHQMWYLIASLIFIVMCLQWGSWAWTALVNASRRRNKRAAASGLKTESTSASRHDPEIGTGNGTNVVADTSASRPMSLRYVPTYIVSAIRTLLFRKTITFTIPMISFSGPRYFIWDQYMINVAELLLTIVYIVALFTWNFVNTTTVAGVRLSYKYWANRAGTLATAQFPLITVLGTKNIICMATRINTERVNYLHRMTARVMFVLLWVHAAGWIKYGINAYEMGTQWMQLGIFGTVAFVILIITSLRPVRKEAYELFFLTHFVMALITLIGTYYHVRLFAYHQYIWPCFFIWGLDRLIRVGRVAFFNFSHYFSRSISNVSTVSPSSSSSSLPPNVTPQVHTQATLTMLSSHCVQVTIPRPPLFHWYPGQSAMLTIPRVYTLTGVPLEAHPFTISSYDSSLHTDASEISADAASDDEKTFEKAEHRNPFSHDLVFLIDSHKGFTRRLASAAIKASNSSIDPSDERTSKPKTFKVLIDGPYGVSPDLTGCETVVLIAGGSGIAYTLPVFLDLIQCVKLGKSDTTRVVFIWAIRSAEHITWISTPMFQSLSQLSPSLGLTVEVKIYVTHDHNANPKEDWDDDSMHGSDEANSESRGSDETEIESPVSPVSRTPTFVQYNSGSASETSRKGKIRSSISKSPESEILSLSCVSMFVGRPNLEPILRDTVEGTITGGEVSVHVCGSNGIANAVRSALAYNPTNVLRGGATVSLHVESFGL